jgi:hypothetical protein
MLFVITLKLGHKKFFTPIQKTFRGMPLNSLQTFSDKHCVHSGY